MNGRTAKLTRKCADFVTAKWRHSGGQPYYHPMANQGHKRWWRRAWDKLSVKQRGRVRLQWKRDASRA